MTKPTLLITGGPAFASLVPALAEQYDLLFAFPQAAQDAANSGIQNIALLGNYMTPDAKERADNETAIVSARVAADLDGIGNRVTGAYRNISMPPNLNGNLKDWFAGYALTRFHPIMLTLTALEAAAADRQIVGCLVHEDLTPDPRTMVLFCKTRGIPTFHLPHQTCHLLPGIEDIHRHTRADWILASGEYMREFYISGGHPPNKIVLVGVPQWDGYYSNQFPVRDEARRVLHLDDGLVICYATTWAQTTSLRSEFERELQAGLAAIIQTAKDMGATLVIKMHPNENPAGETFYSEQMKAAGAYGLVTRQHLNYCLLASNVLMAQGPSNLCIESALLGVPPCYIQTEGFDYSHELPYRCELDNLRETLEMTLSTRIDWNEFLHRYNDAHPNGDATIRAVEMICNTVSVPTVS